MEIINTIGIGIVIFFLGWIIKIDKATIKDLKERLKLYDPENVNRIIEERIKLKDTEKDVEIKKKNKCTEKTITTVLKGTERVFNFQLNKLLLEKRIETCNLIKEGADLNVLIEDSKKKLNELEKKKFL